MNEDYHSRPLPFCNATFITKLCPPPRPEDPGPLILLPQLVPTHGEDDPGSRDGGRGCDGRGGENLTKSDSCADTQKIPRDSHGRMSMRTGQ